MGGFFFTGVGGRRKEGIAPGFLGGTSNIPSLFIFIFSTLDRLIIVRPFGVMVDVINSRL